MRSVVDAVASTLAEVDAAAPALAIGHSYGGTVLAAGVCEIDESRAIYVDAPTISRGGWDFDETVAEYAESRASRTYLQLRERRSHYSDHDCEVEARAAEEFDPATAARLAVGTGGDWTPSAPPASLLVRARPSDYVSDEAADLLRSRGVEVRDIPGAAHSVWYSHFDEFMAAIDDYIDG